MRVTWNEFNFVIPLWGNSIMFLVLANSVFVSFSLLVKSVKNFIQDWIQLKLEDLEDIVKPNQSRKRANWNFIKWS
jgi:hypothetical protein